VDYLESEKKWEYFTISQGEVRKSLGKFDSLIGKFSTILQISTMANITVFLY